MTTDEQITALQRQIKNLKTLLGAAFVVSLALLLSTASDVGEVEDRLLELETNSETFDDGGSAEPSNIDASVVDCLQARDDELSDSLASAMNAVDRALGSGYEGIGGSQGWSHTPRLSRC